MSNLIPPLLSSSPPPIVGPLDEEDDDEFGDFRAAADSYDCDAFSLPPSPQKSPEKELKTDFSKVNLDINYNKSQKVTSTSEMPTQHLNGSVNEEVDKDFQDRRKSSDNADEIQVNCSNSKSPSPELEVVDSHKDDTSHVDIPQTSEEQTVKDVCEEMSECTSDQITKIQNSELDDFSDIQCAAPSSVSCNESSPAETIVNKTDGDQSIEENPFEGSSGSVHENTNNSNGLSETHEISENKSEEDVTDEINEVSDKDEKYDKFENSSKGVDNEFSGSSLSIQVGETDLKLSDDEFGDFGNFGGCEIADTVETSDDEFDDFVNPLPSQSESVQETGDDFGDFESSDFADFPPQSSQKSNFLEVDEKNAAEKSVTILKEIFPVVETQIDDYEFVDQTKVDKIFHELRDVTETNALIYQWSKSNSQKMFFKALNIDTRNILYGPSWNSSMPRFAANLGLAPLEPVKSEILTPAPFQNVASPSNSSQKSNGDIPTAQFDWSSSGLINPLDSTSAELPGSAPEDSSPPQIPTDFLPATSEKPESLPSLFDSEILQKISGQSTSDNENIALSKPSIQEDLSPFESPKLIPLRETHISSEPNDFNGKPGWLQPTIVTPDLPRKETVIDTDDDEFDDFQMVLPEDKKEEKKSKTLDLDLSEFDLTSRVVPSVDKSLHNQEHIGGVSLISGPTVQKLPNNVNDDDDEFTDFHSSVPQVENFKPMMTKSEIFKPQTEIFKPQNEIFKPSVLPLVPQPEILKPLQPVHLEPLKPIVQYSTPMAQINWPNPGVSDEDIRNIELTYSRKDETKENNSKTVKENVTSKNNSFDDDEWTDFVSVNPVNPAPTERTATPDLPLSVLNLNNVQAPKQPIPVITHSGLVQTKLSSTMTLQPKSVVQTSVQPHLFRPPTSQFHPSLISSQFAATGGGPTPSGKSQGDDDDWSDFVSGPQVNGYQQKTASQVKSPPTNWSTAATNIIMNPTHFEAFPTYPPPQKKSPMPARNPVSSISTIPDLDFIAPKNRTSKK